MTDAQFGALLTAVLGGLTGLAGMLKWAVTRITKAMDDQSKSNLRLADAQLELASALSALRADIDHITRWIYAHTPGAVPITVERERTPVQSMPTLTPTGLRAFVRERDTDEESGYGERPGSQRRRDAGPPRRKPSRDQTPNYRRPDSNHDEE